MAPAISFVSREVPQQALKSEYIDLTPICPSHYVASPRAAICLRAGTQLSLALLAGPVLSQLTFKAPAGYTESGNSTPLVFKASYNGDLSSPGEFPGAFPSPQLQLSPSCGQLLTTIFALPKLSDVASLLLLSVVEFVLPVF